MPAWSMAPTTRPIASATMLSGGGSADAPRVSTQAVAMIPAL